MTIAFTKTVSSLQAYKDIDGETNVVFAIYWNLIAEENGYTSSCPATTYIPYTAGQSFTPYIDLTPEQVISWIDQYTPLAQMQQYQNNAAFSLQQQQQQDAPPLPWAPAPVPPTP